MKILTGTDAAPILPLNGRAVAVLGFGNQGRAHALNLRDSGVSVIVGARPRGQGATEARAAGFDVRDPAEAARAGDLIILALPDAAQAEVYRSAIEPNVRAGAILGFLHGFAIRFGLIKPRSDLGVVMVAPKGPGTLLRETFTQGRGIPCLLAVHQDSPARTAEAVALAWAGAIGCARAGVIITTFSHETETDLFGEQAVLCGGLTWLILAAFETLVEAGYPAELAYLECCHEVKQIADLIYARGPAGMMQAISNTAEFGAHHAGPLVVDDRVRQRLRDLLEEIRSGSFAQAIRDDQARDFVWFQQQRRQLESHSIQSPGQIIRSLMPWLNQPEQEHRRP